MIFPSDFFEKVLSMTNKIILEGAISVKAAVERAIATFSVYIRTIKKSRAISDISAEKRKKMALSV